MSIKNDGRLYKEYELKGIQNVNASNLNKERNTMIGVQVLANVVLLFIPYGKVAKGGQVVGNSVKYGDDIGKIIWKIAKVGA